MVIMLQGDLDVSTTPELRDLLAQVVHEDSPRSIVIDLERLNYVDSTGLSVFVTTNKRVATSGGRFTLANPNPFVMRILEVTALDRTLDVVGDGYVPPERSSTDESHRNADPELPEA
jgi:anti-sigma B factor antagonist